MPFKSELEADQRRQVEEVVPGEGKTCDVCALWMTKPKAVLTRPWLSTRPRAQSDPRRCAFDNYGLPRAIRSLSRRAMPTGLFSTPTTSGSSGRSSTGSPGVRPAQSCCNLGPDYYERRRLGRRSFRRPRRSQGRRSTLSTRCSWSAP